MLRLTVGTSDLNFLVDTGATYSALNSEVPPSWMSNNTVSVRGFSGSTSTLPRTKPVVTSNGKQTIMHSFVVSTQAPLNLCGRDLLVKLGATILCHPRGLVITWPDGSQTPCGHTTLTSGIYVMTGSGDRCVDIYWGRVHDAESEIERLYKE